jgi:hypothetical protein
MYKYGNTNHNLFLKKEPYSFLSILLYTKAGFEMVSESAHQSFGQDLIAEFWELPLGG